MRIVPLALLVAACSAPVGEHNTATVDIGNAADAARASVDRYGAQTPATPQPAATPAQATPAQVAQRYWSLVEEKRASEARLLWEDGAKADELATRLARYPAFDARIDDPRDGDAAAGQRRATVPVRLVAHDPGDGAARLIGTMTLRRTVADGSGATRRGWRIAAVDLVAHDPDPVAPPVVTAHFRCERGTEIAVRFDNAADVAELTIGSVRARLAGQRPASGIWYKGAGYELRGKGRDATLTPPDAPPLACRAVD